jgi:hypothetical protein
LLTYSDKSFQRLKGYCLLACIILLLSFFIGTITAHSSLKLDFLAFAFILVFFSIPFLLGKARILLFLFIALIPVSSLAGASILEAGGFTITRLIWIFAFGLWTTKLAITKSSLVIVPEFKWLIGLCCVIIISSATGRNLWGNLVAFQSYLQLFILFFLITQIFKSPKDLFSIGWILISSLSILALWVLFNGGLASLSGGVAPTDYEKMHLRSEASYRDPNITALYFSIAIPFVLYYLRIYKDVIKRVFLIICLMLLVLGIVMTLSMGGAIGLVSIMIFFVLFDKRVVTRKKVLLIAVSIPLLLTMFALMPSTFKLRAQSKYDVITNGDFAEWGTGRGACWLAALHLIGQNPFLGAGITDYRYFMAQQLRVIAGSDLDIVAAHNMFLGISAQSGLFALLFFIALIYSVLKRLSEKLRRFTMDHNSFYLGSAIYLSLIAFLIQAMFLDMEAERYLYLLFALAAIFSRADEQPRLNVER